MTGLNLETLLRLLRADLGAWISLGAVLVILALMTWTSWGKRRALRKCLVLSIVVHSALVLYGRDQAARMFGPVEGNGVGPEIERIQEIRVIREDLAGPTGTGGSAGTSADGLGSAIAPWDKPAEALALAEPDLNLDRPEPPPAEPLERPDPATPPEPVADASAPEIAAPEVAPPEPRTVEVPEAPPTAEPPPIAPGEALPVNVTEPEPSARRELAMPDDPIVPRPVSPDGIGPSRPTADLAPSDPAPTEAATASAVPTDPPPSRPTDLGSPVDPAPAPRAADGSDLARVEPVRPAPPAVALAMPDRSVGPRAGNPGGTGGTAPPRRTTAPAAVPLAGGAPAPVPRLPDTAPARVRPLPEIPEVYRSRLAPDRSERALASGASPSSEQAVERALAWLARHQDPDGRWDAGTRKLADRDAPAPGETNHTKHCPPGDRCLGECYYYEADTATTGLALLAFLGAGHTHQSGPHARTVALGLNFLIRSQKSDGDLRGISRGVGMYCHAIASLALCEAYALTGDARLRRPAERAVDFLVQSRSADDQSWRYAPSDPYGGDTSILGWAIMVLKSARETGIPVPPDVRLGALKWLDRVAEGDRKGLALYRPGEGYPITPTMTAEAWACRQFLGVGGPGPASDEAAAYLLLHNPDRDPFNLYYWYYATLAMYQHGGEPWIAWNARVRDQLVRRQVRGGHADGSWDPAECRDQYDLRGGRVYTTALAALTLEVYYRYLRLYDAPATPSPPMANDPAVRRSGFDPTGPTP